MTKFHKLSQDFEPFPILQTPHDDVAKKYGVPRAKVKELQESASKFALMVAAFCECLGWSDLDILISKFQVRHV